MLYEQKISKQIIVNYYWLNLIFTKEKFSSFQFFKTKYGELYLFP